jgi:hypothetical protein
VNLIRTKQNAATQKNTPKDTSWFQFLLFQTTNDEYKHW